ncbi:hypothetical protein CF327_g5124 [Tilletia walkeri]|uniref:Stress-response A/B barrel domain-containing protein n=1 Tax=Tilletia walkeri TaxID=117179 RepID=A0A8X7N792_9BASI|nr:hypothetical protein CF327_g5124 [Tilletia walkeri]KAE8267653.1 hypothetical protein A4X09_0g4688 [Tilletia walkeri]
MVFVHIVLVKVKPEVASAGLDEFIKKVDTLKSLDVVKEKCIACEHGPPVIPDRTQGYDYGLYTHFNNKADYEVYRDDPGHREFVKTVIAPHTDSVLAYDWDHS